MKLVEATALIENHSRYFIDVYKQFNFSDDSDLRDYLEFILHEPVEWMRGFPSKWKSASLFTKPRAAFHKLLKHGDVITALGDEYATKVHDIIWRAFKDHTETILTARTRLAPSVLDQMLEENNSLSDDDEDTPVPTKNPTTSQPSLFVKDDDLSEAGESVESDVQSFHSLKKSRPQNSVVIPETSSVSYHKYSVLLAAFKALIDPVKQQENGEIDRLRKACSILLDEFNRI